MVAIVGRPNVGKSTLFNRILGKQRAIVHDVEGITRDRFINEASWEGRRFRLVDTGGIVETPVDEITRKMQAQVQQAIDDAHVVIFVLDGQQEITRPDRVVCESLLRSGKPVVLAVNKLDNPKLALNLYDYYALGIGEPHAISSGHNLGIDALMREVIRHLPDPGETDGGVPTAGGTDADLEEANEVIKVAIVGRPNVGKSSFVNAILNEERISSPMCPAPPATPSISSFTGGAKYLLIDTAGLRRKAGIRKPVEHFSVAAPCGPIRHADVCLVGQPRKNWRNRTSAYRCGRARRLYWCGPKWDLVENKVKRLKALEDDLDLKMPQGCFAPRLTIYIVTRTRLFFVFYWVDRVAAEAAKRIGTAELNRLMEQIKAKHNPPGKKGVHAKILYATQAGVKPTEIVLFVNQKRLFHFNTCVLSRTRFGKLRV